MVQRDTQAEADRYLQYYVVEKGDDVAVNNLCEVLIEQSQSIPAAVMDMMKFHIKAGWGGYPLVGTADRITTELEHLSKLGIDGVLINWVNFNEGLEQWARDVMPRLEQAGLHKPVLAPAR